MEGTKQFKVSIGGQDLVIETGLLAQQAAGAVTVSYGDSTVFTAVTNTDTPREGIDFFPLQCEYREKFYAAGKFPGGFFKREARPSSKEIQSLTEHLKQNKKDHSSRYGLLRKVNNRRKLLDYIKREDEAKYKDLIKKLGLRR